jgi:death-on-curing protein
LRHHPFTDGNKRSAFAVLTILLEINRYCWTCSEVEETGMFLLATVGEISEAEFTAWVERSIVPK